VNKVIFVGLEAMPLNKDTVSSLRESYWTATLGRNHFVWAGFYI